MDFWQRSPAPNPLIAAEIMEYAVRHGIVATSEEQASLLAYLVASNKQIAATRRVDAFRELAQASGMQFTREGLRRAAQVLDMGDLFGEGVDVGGLVEPKPTGTSGRLRGLAAVREWASINNFRTPTGELKVRPDQYTDTYHRRMVEYMLRDMTASEAMNQIRADERLGLSEAAGARAAAKAGGGGRRSGGGGRSRSGGPAPSAKGFKPPTESAMRVARNGISRHLALFTPEDPKKPAGKP